MSDYDKAIKASLMPEDLAASSEAVDRASNMFGSRFIIESFSMTVSSKDGYIIGEVWFDPASERFLFNYSKYGEPS